LHFKLTDHVPTFLCRARAARERAQPIRHHCITLNR